MSNKIRILIADDHVVVRRGLALVLRQEADFQIVGEASDGQEAVNLIANTAPHLALLDWKMPNMDGLQTAYKIKKNNNTIRTLILSGAPVETAVLDALDNGVDGFVHKDISPDGLAHAIRIVAGGQTYLSPEVTAILLQRSRQVTPPKPVTLSPRELEVLQWMASAGTYADIAKQLTISETTVRTHVKRILTKLKQPNRTQAVIAALRLNLITLE